MRDKNEVLHVEGAKAGSKQKQPYRAAVTSTTNQKMRITYGLSEGEIAGFNALGNFTETDMLKRIFLDGTPIMSEEGERLLDVNVEFRSGTQDQSVISGLPSVTIENGVNVEVKLNAPVSRSFTRTETTSFDVRISVPQLWDGDAEGNSRKGTIQFRIEVSVNNGPFNVAGTFTVNEKIIDGWSQTYNVPATKGSAHTIRIVRMNSERVNEFSANKLIVDSIVEVTDVRLRYPRTALLYLEYNADQFSNIPKLEVQMFGKADILVPANYNPISRVYSTTGVGTSNGVWDGTFKRAYTDNPVWIWLDLITSKRYGTGNRITIDMVDKWELYGLSRYCDQLVPDGKGGQEPRFTCNNLYLQKSEDAFKVLKDLTAMFRSKTVWDGTKIRAVADVPRTPALAFTSSNCKDIVYSSVDTSAQHNLVNVQYYDKTNRFASKIEMRRDARNIVQRDRVVEMNFTALGCTSAGQAQRIAQYILVSELNEQNIVSFTTGLEGSIPKLNDVFYFADEYVAGRVIGGRVVSITGQSVKLDREVPLAVGTVADPNVQLILNRDDGTTAPIRITSVAQDKRTVYLQFAPPASVGPELQWTLITPQVMPQMFYITDIEYNDKDKTYNISGMQYLESKYGAIDGDARIVAPPISINENSMLKAPATLSARYFVKIVQDISVCDIEVSWAQSANATKYQLEMRKDNGEWRIVGSYTSLTAELENMYTGIYEFRITAYDTLNNASQYTYSSPLNVQGKVLPPPALSVYMVQGILLGFQHNWVYPAHTEDSRGVRIRRALQDPAVVVGQTYEIVDVAYPSNSYTQNNVPSNTTAWFSAAIVDKYGVIGAYTDWVKASVNDDPDQIMDLIEGSVALKDLDEELRKDLTDTKDLASTANQNAESAKAAANAAEAAANAAKIAADDAAAQAGQNATNISNEAAARIAADKVESDARIAAVATLQDGLSTETQQRKDAVSSLTQTVTNNKASTDASIANVQNQVTSQASTLASQASQLSSLDARTTTAETNIANVTQKADAAVAQGQSNATAITTLQGSINTINGQLANKAETSAVDTLSQKVTANEGNISTHTQQLASLTNSVTTLQGDISKKADAGALTTLEGRVSVNEGAISSQSGQLTNLSNSITTLNGQMANKAESSAVTNLESRVSTNENNITSLSGQTAALTNRVGNVKAYSIVTFKNGSGAGLTKNRGIYSGNGVHMHWIYRGLNLIVYTVAGDIASVSNYDTYANVGTATQDLYAAINALTDGTYFSIIGNDNIGGVNDWGPADALRSLLLTCGASDQYYKQWNWSNIPLFTGRKYIDAGNGILDIFTSSVQDQWIEYPLTIINGVPQGMSGQRAIATIQDAQATAISTLNNSVSIHDNQLTSLSGAVTTLQNNVTNINGTLAQKADANAVTTLSNRVDTAEGKITSQGNSITALTNKITNNDLSNLVLNPGFVDPKSDWTSGVIVDATDAAPNPPSAKALRLNDRDSYYGPFVKCNVGDMFYVSAWFATPNTSATASAELGFNARNSVGHYSWHSVVIKSTDKNAWGMVEGYFTVPNGMVDIRPWLLVNIAPSEAAGQQWHVTNIQVRNITGNKKLATDLQATSSALSTLDSKVTNIDGRVTSASNNIASLKNQLGNTASYTLVTFRNGSAVGMPKDGGIHSYKGKISGFGRGLNLIVFNNGDVVSCTAYDTYGDVYAGCNEIYAAINALASGTYFAIVGTDNIGAVGAVNPDTNLRALLLSCGAGDRYFRSWNWNALPIFVGRKDLDAGNGILGMFDSTVGNQWIEYPLTFVNGAPMGMGDARNVTAQLDANAAAISSLSNTVTQHGNDIVSLSQQNTQLNNSITTINGQLATKADSGALSTLESRVALTEGTLTAHGQAITQVQASADLALNGKTYWVDMTGHDPNLYYPVFIQVSDWVGVAEIAIDVPLYTSNAPWSSHHSGTFALNIRWSVKGSGWGANPIEREITKFGWGWTQNGQSPAMDINQQVERSCEYIYLRGGTKYKFTCNQYAQAPFMESSYQGVVYAPNRVPKSIGATTSANASAITTLDAKVDVVDGKAQSAANATTLLRTDVDGHTTALQLHAQSINGIESKYTVKIDNNGYISGYGLISTTNNGIPTSAFTVNADFFSVGKVGDSTSYKPFVVVTSSNQVIDGVTYPETGVYMRQAFMSKLSVTTAHIKDLSVTAAKIANLAVDSAKIADLAVTTSKIGNLAVDTLHIKDRAVTLPVIVTKPAQTTAEIYRYTPNHYTMGEFLRVVLTGFQPYSTILITMFGQLYFIPHPNGNAAEGDLTRATNGAMYFKLGDDYLVNYTAANNVEITIPPVKFGSTELGTSFSVLAKADASGQLVLSGYFDMMTFAYANRVTAGCSDLTFYAVELKK